MEPISAVNIWKSPIPYLFGGLALVLLLISAALVLLACSYRKRSSPPLDDVPEKLPAAAINGPADASPKFVVIMAGDDKPTYLAHPAAASAPTTTCSCDKV